MNAAQRRKQLFHQINTIIDLHCTGCQKKEAIADAITDRKQRDAKVQRYCLKQCSFGLKLQQLGSELGNADRHVPIDQVVYRRKGESMERVPVCQ